MPRRPPPHLRRRLLLLGLCLALIVVIALVALLANQRRVGALVDEGLDSTVPEVLELQRAAANLERLIRFGWVVATAASPGDWRPASIAAQALSHHPSLTSDTALASEVQAVYGVVRAVGRLREEALVLREESPDRAAALEDEARRLWQPQEVVLVRLQDSLASKAGRLTVDRFNAIAAVTELTGVTGTMVAGLMLVALLLAGLVVHRELLNPVLRLTDAMRIALNTPDRGIELPPPSSVELATMQDATFRLQTALREAAAREAALRESQRRLSSIFAASEAGITLADAQGNLIEANDAFHRMLGYPPGGLLSLNFRDLSHPDDLPAEEGMLARLASGETDRYRVDKRGRRKDGSQVWTDVSVAALRGPDGAVEQYVAVAIDISERMRAQQDGRFLQAMVDQSRDSIYCLVPDEGFRNVYINAAACRHFGRERDELLRMRVPDWDPNVGDAEIADMWQQVRQDKRIIIETVHRTKQGEVPVEVSLNYLLHDGREFMAGYIRDIRDQKRWMDQIQRSNEDLQQFAYVASHDLQEPLRVVASFLQLLERRYGASLDQTAHEYIAFAVNGAQRMKQLIEDLLEFSRVESMGRPVRPVDLDWLMGQVLANLGRLVSDSGAEILMPAPLPRVRGDVAQLGRLLQNLVGNAIKYRHPQRPPRVTITAEPGEHGRWVIAVADNGIGIAPEYYDRIFLIFQRLHGHGEYDGTGIGLSICKRIVERHGGQIWVESQEGQGSTIRFTLPAV